MIFYDIQQTRRKGAELSETLKKDRMYKRRKKCVEKACVSIGIKMMSIIFYYEMSCSLILSYR